MVNNVRISPAREASGSWQCATCTCSHITAFRSWEYQPGSFCGEGQDKTERRPAWQPHYLRVVADVFSTNVQVCQSPVNLRKFIFLVASVFYNGSFNLFLLCLQGFLLSGVFRLCLFFFSCGSESVNDDWSGNMPLSAKPT